MTDLGIYGDSPEEQANGARFEKEQAEHWRACDLCGEVSPKKDLYRLAGEEHGEHYYCCSVCF